MAAGLLPGNGKKLLSRGISGAPMLPGLWSRVWPGASASDGSRYGAVYWTEVAADPGVFRKTVLQEMWAYAAGTFIYVK